MQGRPTRFGCSPGCCDGRSRHSTTVPAPTRRTEESSRLLLASVHVTLASLTTPPTTAGTAVNNLVRPFVRANALLAALSLP